jgi:hypothetical protein
MSAEEDKAVMRSYMAATNSLDLDAFADHLAAEYIGHQMNGPDLDRDSLLRFAKEIVPTLETDRFAIDHLIAEGDFVVLLGTRRPAANFTHPYCCSAHREREDRRRVGSLGPDWHWAADGGDAGVVRSPTVALPVAGAMPSGGYR